MANGGFLLTIGGSANTSIGGIISGTGGLAENGSGTLTLTGVNTYSVADATINAGTLAVNSATAMGASSGSITINAGTLEATATFTSNRSYVLGNAASTIMVDPSQTFTIGNVISGSGGLTKTGTGTLTLAGTANNTYSGLTTVADGTLLLNMSAGEMSRTGT